MSSVWIYHEQQESALCGQHCLNNLLQNAYFSAPDLSDIALELDASERSLHQSSSSLSGNVDESGNFSVQVLRAALKRSHGLDLVSWSSEEGRGSGDPTTQDGFIINAHDHWFAVRRVNGHWWDLNSTADKPAYISNFYLSAMLSQYREEGFTVFLVVGAVPAGGVKSDLSNSANAGMVARWYNENNILPSAQRSSNPAAVAAPAAFSGAGHRLGSTSANTAKAREIIDVDALGEDDEDLKQAIFMSMNDLVKANEKSEKEIMREKRLKMLGGQL